MTALKDILYKVTLNAVAGATSIDVSAIDFDSRNIKKGHVFVAVKGTVSDGHQFIETAIGQGAVAIVCETLPENLTEGITYVEGS
nr:Mur ligase domain-containing protein [Mariniflexile sp.]